MKFSIITATLNSQETINKTLNSIISQDYHDYEVIFVDGHSTDKTINLINNSNIKNKTIINQNGKGVYNAFNEGIKCANGEIILILNSDDYFKEANSLFEINNLFVKYSNIPLFISNIEMINKNDNIIRNYKSNNFKKFMFYFGHMPPHPGVFIKKEIYEKYGLFSENYENAGDFEFLVRVILKQKINFKIIKKCFIQMSYGGKSNKNLQSFLKNTIEIKKALNMNNIQTSYFLVIIRFIIKVFQFSILPRGK